MRNLSDIIKQLTLVTQLGLSLITPLLMCLGISWWLYAKAGFGGWIFLPGFFFGLGGSGTFAYKLYLSVNRRGEKEKKKKSSGISFNRHV